MKLLLQGERIKWSISVPRDVPAMLERKSWHVSHSTSYRGCVYNFFLTFFVKRVSNIFTVTTVKTFQVYVENHFGVMHPYKYSDLSH